MAKPRRVYVPRGAALDIFHHQDPEILLSGPAGTGKSRGAIEKLHALLSLNPGARGLMLRKTLASLTSSGLVTYQKHVLRLEDDVQFFSGNKREPAQFRYPVDRRTGDRSILTMGGLDNPMKVMSTEYDVIYVQESTEVSEDDWESLTTRLRNNVIPFQQLIADCNPDAPNHWLKQRCDAGTTLMLESRHEDNPTLFDDDGVLIPGAGAAYMDTLDRLTGVRLQRLRHGRWVAAEGIVYEGYARLVHRVDIHGVPKRARHVVGVDWGFTNPGVLAVYAIDGDGRLCLVEEVYRTRQLMDWWTAEAKRIQKQYHPEMFVCDPAEPGYIAAFRSAGLNCTEGYNEIRPGITAVQERLQVAGDRRPRLSFYIDALRERDEDLAEHAKPYCTDHEFDSYVWPKGNDGRPLKEKPVDEHNHALDTLRYVVCYVDKVGKIALTGNRTAVSGPRQQPPAPR